MNKKYWLFGIIIILIIIAGLFLIKDKSGQTLGASIFNITRTTSKASPSATTDASQIAVSGQQAAVPGSLQLPTAPDQTLFLAGGYNATGSGSVPFNDVYSSTDMQNWTLISPNMSGQATKWSKRFYPETVFFNNKFWVIGGNYLLNNSGVLGDVWSSPDGISWTNIQTNIPQSFSQYFHYETTVFNGKIWAIGGQKFANIQSSMAMVWSSSDGITWNEVTNSAPWGARVAHTLISFNGKMYVIGGRPAIGGNGNIANAYDVWTTSDGVNWNQITTNTPWGPLNYAKGIVFNNQMYLIGGSEVGSNISSYKVWKSSDGITWTLVSQNLPFANYTFSQEDEVVVANGKIWLSDHASPPQTNHLWNSSDGVTWTPVVGALPWTPRFGYRMIVKPGSINPAPLPGNSAPVQLLPNLTVSSFIFPPTVVAGPNQYLSVEVTVKNIGTGSANLPVGTRIRVYKDSVLPANVQGETVLTQSMTILSNHSYTFKFNTLTNATLFDAAGNYNLIAYADGPTQGASAPAYLVVETNENNNTLAVPITVTP